MYRLLTSAQAKALDNQSVEAGITGLAQMEAAAAKAGVVACQLLADDCSSHPPNVVILAGRGNNGGDGIALARHLRALDLNVELWLCAGTEALPAEAAANLRAWVAGGGRVRTPELHQDSWDALAASLARGPALVVDALLGTGQTKAPHGAIARAIDLICSSAAGIRRPPRRVLALDVPTGLCADTGRVFVPHLRASTTVTFGLPKIGLFTGDGPGVAGEVVLASLGWPAVIAGGPGTRDLTAPPETWLLTADDARAALPVRAASAHKGDAGRVLAVAGSKGMAGAAALCAMGAIRAGAGLVTVALPVTEQQVTAMTIPEAMTLPLPVGASYGLLASNAATAEVLRAATAADAVAAGPGLGRSPGASAVLRALVQERGVPLVLDADGLNAFVGRLGELARRPGDAPLVLTPHPGELARLLGRSVAEVQADRLAAARSIVEATGAICLLKGRGTIVATPGGSAWLIPAGNPAMATGGMGDVLTGAVAALVAAWVRGAGGTVAGADQALTESLALQVAVAAMLHSIAGDLAAAQIGPVGLRASDVAQRLPAAYQVCMDVCASGPGAAAGTRIGAGAGTGALPPSLARSLKGVTQIV